MKQVLILGDSSSMTLGIERKSYPFCLADQSIWEEGVEFINGSQPGFTSSGIRAFFVQYNKQFKNLASVIIYIGNNDGVSTEHLQGKYTHLKDAFNDLKKAIGLERKLSFHNSLTPFKWNDFYDPSKEKLEKISDFEYNINQILLDCQKKSIQVILIIPKAHVLFPAGLGKGNFIFYRYLGVNDILSNKLFVDNKEFLKALFYQEKKEYKKARVIYKRVLESAVFSTNNEYLLTVVNNYAVACAEMGKFEEAKVLFNTLLKEPFSRKEIVLYNQAQLYRKMKKTKEYEQMIDKAYTTDRTIFRIQQEYKDVLLKLGKKFSTISLIKMDDFIKDNEYIDYCHVLPSAHEKITQKIIPLLKENVSSGNHQARITNILTNPELAFGNTSDFYTYLQTGIDDRFPEFSFMSWLIPYLRIFESKKLLKNIKLDAILRSSQQLESILPPSVHKNIVKEPIFNKISDTKWFTEHIKEVRGILLEHLKDGNQINNRFKTTMYWYFRESLRYGFHSRISMRYNRVILERCAEELAIAAVFNWKWRLKKDKEVQKLFHFLIQIDTIHHSYCKQFAPEEDNTILLKKYDAELFKLADIIERI
jgi:tetratricopeptide (TPR) repeat protein